ncbi:MAG: hypothetical protein CML42_04615 [Rhodobacteraceae bacterium]|nr:hypothetical protein [Paracoccaceae bacterium]
MDSVKQLPLGSLSNHEVLIFTTGLDQSGSSLPRQKEKFKLMASGPTLKIPDGQLFGNNY